MPHLPFKPDNFASWTAPKLLPAISTNAPSPNQPGGDKSNTLLYLGLGVLTLVVIGGAIYLINQNNELRSELSDISFELKMISRPKAQEQTSHYLSTDSKSKEDEGATWYLEQDFELRRYFWKKTVLKFFDIDSNVNPTEDVLELG